MVMTGLAMLAVLATLITGLVGLSKGGEFNRKYGNRLMRLRVLLQGFALLMFALAVMTR